MSVRKITAAFGSASGVAIDIAQYADSNWRSAWLILSPQEYSWFIIDRVYWRKQIKAQVIKVPDDSQDQKMVTEAATWIKSNDYHLKYSDRGILLNESAWLKDNLMDSAQKLICKSLGDLASWWSVFNWQRRGTPFHKVGKEHIQLIHDGINHWLSSFNSNGRVQVCHSLYETPGSVIKRCLKALYNSLLDKDGKLSVTMIPVQKQKGSSSCGLFAIAFTTNISGGISPVESEFNVTSMRKHLLECVEKQQLSAFPQNPKRA